MNTCKHKPPCGSGKCNCCHCATCAICGYDYPFDSVKTVNGRLLCPYHAKKENANV